MIEFINLIFCVTQDNVRVAAVTLSRALLNLTARLCDTQYTKTADAAAAVEATLPILLGKGLTDHAKEVRAVSIQALIRIVKIAGPLMRPHLAALLTSLLEGESSLEPALFNYLQFHTEVCPVCLTNRLSRFYHIIIF